MIASNNTVVLYKEVLIDSANVESTQLFRVCNPKADVRKS